jgi:hypothetical protein
LENVGLPQFVHMLVTFDNFVGASYLSIDLTNAGVLEGIDYEGWCADLDRGISTSVEYNAEVFNTYDPSAAYAGLLENPGNVPNVAWLLNEGFRSLNCAATGRPYSVGEIQWAIWELIEGAGAGPTNDMGSVFSLACAQEVYAAASAPAGDNYAPQCNEELLLLLEPLDASGNYCHQAQFITIPCPCTTTSTTTTTPDVPYVFCNVSIEWGFQSIIVGDQGPHRPADQLVCRL